QRRLRIDMASRFHLRAQLLLLVAAVPMAACFLPSSEKNNNPPPLHPPGQPVGPIASNAQEAWPDRPMQPMPLTASEILDGCAAWAACQTNFSDRLTAAQLCVNDVEQNAERTIPISFSSLGERDERPEFFVRCAAQNAGNCSAVTSCLTTRTAEYNCQEDGCIAQIAYSISCEGSVAVMTRSDGQVDRRDCARAFTSCDPSSETGCTDRLFTQCDPSKPGTDRCDSDIRLGCDNAGQISYHDCARLGGTCGVLSGGGQGCVYPTAAPCTSVDSVL